MTEQQHFDTAIASAPILPPKADFSRREYDLPELLDGECTYPQWRAAALSLARLNRLTGAYKPTLAFMKRAWAYTRGQRNPLTVVDVGCGHGDTLRMVYRWAKENKIPVRLTGIDSNRYAVRLAQERDKEENIPLDAISWIVGDAFSWKPSSSPDLILSSLFAHHLNDLEILRFLQWCERTSTVGWLTVDLARSARSATAARWLMTLLGMHPFLKHDAPISFRRALSREEWEILLRGQGLSKARLLSAGSGRIAVESLR